MKNKQSKYSIFYDSTKNKHRKQEQNDHSQTFHGKKFSNPNKCGSFIGENRKNPSFSKNNPNEYRNHSATAVGPFFIDEDDTFSRPDYTYQKTTQQKDYHYGFTNSKFIYFLGNLTPKEYLLFITLIALLITEDLNETEAKIVYAFTSNVADTMQTIVEQEIILSKYKHNVDSKKLNQALHHDFETIYAELAKIKKKLPK